MTFRDGVMDSLFWVGAEVWDDVTLEDHPREWPPHVFMWPSGIGYKHTPWHGMVIAKSAVEAMDAFRAGFGPTGKGNIDIWPPERISHERAMVIANDREALSLLHWLVREPAASLAEVS